jgi:DNA mismatch repair protein MutL
MRIKTLSPITINRIAAGEVVERPASAIKELVENSIDALATQIDITIHNAGRNSIIISDNGIGMTAEELMLATERHTTSKLDETNIQDIRYFGFRGEALPSIASVSRMHITSKPKDFDQAWSLYIEGGEKKTPTPAAHNTGTKIEVRDLFFATPARLKFLKTEKTEQQHIIDIIHRIALAHPTIAFSLKSEQRELVKLPAARNEEEALQSRISLILGKEFAENSVYITNENLGMSIKAYASLPTFNRGTASELYFFANNRPIKDKLLLSSVKVAYQDFMAQGRYPSLVLFLNLPPEEIDVNVHPAKTEVRFRDERNVRSFIISTLKHAITSAAQRVSNVPSAKALSSFVPQQYTSYNTSNNYQPSPAMPKEVAETNFKFQAPLIIPSPRVTEVHRELPEYKVAVVPETRTEGEKASFPLGSARCQIDDTFIVAETEHSLVIVDQHAAHERLVYEKLKQHLAQNQILRQRLLIPEIVELEEKVVDLLVAYKAKLSDFGLFFEICGQRALMITEIPLLLKDCDIKALIKDIGDDLLEFSEDLSLSQIQEHILETFSCHHSIRAGRRLSITEMNAMLREMEATPYSGQCNHGRPTYIELKLKDIEKLFGRN